MKIKSNGLQPTMNLSKAEMKKLGLHVSFHRDGVLYYVHSMGDAGRLHVAIVYDPRDRDLSLYTDDLVFIKSCASAEHIQVTVEDVEPFVFLDQFENGGTRGWSLVE